MVIGIFGESCTGKSTIARQVSRKTGAVIHTGNDYLRMAKSQPEAKKQFCQLLLAAQQSRETVIYVISEPEQLALLPEGALRVLVTADLETIKGRFAQRMHGQLPQPVEKMLERKHGCFGGQSRDVLIEASCVSPEAAAEQILACLPDRA